MHMRPLLSKPITTPPFRELTVVCFDFYRDALLLSILDVPFLSPNNFCFSPLKLEFLYFKYPYFSKNLSVYVFFFKETKGNLRNVNTLGFQTHNVDQLMLVKQSAW